MARLPLDRCCIVVPARPRGARQPHPSRSSTRSHPARCNEKRNRELRHGEKSTTSSVLTSRSATSPPPVPTLQLIPTKGMKVSLIYWDEYNSLIAGHFAFNGPALLRVACTRESLFAPAHVTKP